MSFHSMQGQGEQAMDKRVCLGLRWKFFRTLKMCNITWNIISYNEGIVLFWLCGRAGSNLHHICDAKMPLQVKEEWHLVQDSFCQDRVQINPENMIHNSHCINLMALCRNI